MRIIRGEGRDLRSLPSLPTRKGKGDTLGRPFYHDFKRDKSPKPPGYLGTGVTSLAIFGEILLFFFIDLAAFSASWRVEKGPTHT